MDLWINIARDGLIETIKGVDCLILNDEELELLTEAPNFVSAAREVLSWGPTAPTSIIAKQGKYGAALFTRDGYFALPAYPLENVVDPTGAGDSFAGGMMGYLAAQDNFDPKTLKEAMAYGILVASFNVEGFGMDRMKNVTREEIEVRMDEYKTMLTF
jgi:sugar/nucleoside kinase (ribokinase family)